MNGTGPDADGAPTLDDTTAVRLAGGALLGFLWSMGSLMVLSTLPVFLKETLGVSNTRIGLLEGFAIFGSSSSKILAGMASDALGSRVRVIAVGAIATFLVKFVFVAAPLVHVLCGTGVAFAVVVGGKILDRMAKGVRGAPTDALLADLSSPARRSQAYALNQSASNAGALLGTLSATALMVLSRGSLTVTFSGALIPCLAAVFVLLLIVKEQEDEVKARQAGAAAAGGLAGGAAAAAPADPLTATPGGKSPFRAQLRKAAKLPPKFWLTFAVIFMLYLSRFSESFVALRARSIGWPVNTLPLLYSGTYIIQATLAYPMGILSDKLNRNTFLLLGLAALMAGHLCFISLPSIAGTALAFAFCGLHMSMSQCNIKALISESVPVNLRGTAFSVNAVGTGMSLFLGNFIAGRAMDWSQAAGLGTVGAFYGGFLFTAAATLCLYLCILRPSAQAEAEAKAR